MCVAFVTVTDADVLYATAANTVTDAAAAVTAAAITAASAVASIMVAPGRCRCRH
jgi:hypothetical protein